MRNIGFKSPKRAGFWRSDATWAATCLSILFLGYFRAPWAFQVNWQNDEGCYLKYTALLSGIDAGDACRAAFFHAPGVALAWGPAGLLAQLGAALSGIDARDWLVPLAALASFAWLGLALWALAQTLALRGIQRPRTWALALTLGSQVVFYAIHWPLLVHAAEFAAASLLLLALARGEARWALAWAAWLTLIRFNDVPAMILPCVWLASQTRLRARRPQLLILGILAAAAAAAVAWIAFIKGYGPSTLTFLWGALTFDHAFQFLFNDRYGLVWLSPLWIGTLLWGTACLNRLDWTARAALVWAWVEFLVCIAWGGNGGGFGTRYLIGSYAAIFWVALSLLALFPGAKRGYGLAVALSALWMSWLILLYRAAPPFLPELRLIPETGRDQDLGIPRFFFHALVGAFDLRTWLDVLRANLLQGVPALSLYLNTWRATFMQTYNPLYLIAQPALGILATATLSATLFLGHRAWRATQAAGVRLSPSRWGAPALAALIFLSFFRARWAFNLNGESLEACYLRLTSEVLGWNSRALCEQFSAPVLGIGAPILWVPIAALGAGIAHWAGESRASGAIPLVALSSFVLWGLSLHWVHRFLRQTQHLPSAPGYALAYLLSTPLLYFATHVALLPNAAEFAFAMLCLVALQSGHLRRAMAAGLATALVQPASFPIGFVILAAQLTALSGRRRPARPSWQVRAEAGFTLLVTLVFGALAMKALWQGAPAMPPWESALPSLIGTDPGLLWTLPLWVTITLGGLARWRRLTATARAAVGWLCFAGAVSLYSGRYALPWMQATSVGAYAAGLLVLEAGWKTRTSARAMKRLTVGNALTMTGLLILVLNSGWNLFTHAPLQQWPVWTFLLSIPGVTEGPTQALTLTGLPLALLAMACAVALAVWIQEFLRPRR